MAGAAHALPFLPAVRGLDFLPDREAARARETQNRQE